ncbi:unnamed protein product [Brugia timori]|uniref:Uncharacterized protein n=1 Tax=Brugia timori TaxID=42155 RepID=A0A3P7TB14_9BILA|nr:unnamed protein product [Brugia timori]
MYENMLKHSVRYELIYNSVIWFFLFVFYKGKCIRLTKICALNKSLQI